MRASSLLALAWALTRRLKMAPIFSTVYVRAKVTPCFHPQVAMATGQVLFHRFFYSKSFVKHSFEVSEAATRRPRLGASLSLASRCGYVRGRHVGERLQLRWVNKDNTPGVTNPAAATEQALL